jgi:hypothetical protein
MQTIINTTGIQTTDYLSQYTAGKFRFISKCRAGFMTIVDGRDFDNERYMQYPESLINGYKKGALQTVQFNPEGTDIWLTVFARVGKKIHLCDQTILRNLTVGTINGLYYNTNFYSQSQYSAVGATSWASKAFVENTAQLAA